MTSVTVSLPDDLAQQAQAAGLLTESALEQLLRRDSAAPVPVWGRSSPSSMRSMSRP
jgi:hypothetical protein